tara:strand:- start:639 stop:761 length:123 start_codon:yes stop_codon:yes gene_type:complete
MFINPIPSKIGKIIKAPKIDRKILHNAINASTGFGVFISF